MRTDDTVPKKGTASYFQITSVLTSVQSLRESNSIEMWVDSVVVRCPKIPLMKTIDDGK